MMSINTRLSMVILIAGTLLSVVLGLVGYFWPQSQDVANAFILGLVGITITLILEARVKLSDLEANAIDSISDVQMDRAIRAKRDDPFLTDRYMELRQELKDLAAGRYRVRSLPELYQDNARSIKALSSGERLLSTCPVSTVSIEDAIEQIRDLHYRASMQEHLAAAGRGVQVTRIYLFKTRAFFDNPEIRQHLVQLGEQGLNIRVVFRDEVKIYTPIDFLVFGEKKVSMGIIGPDTGMCVGGEVDIDPEVIKRSIRDYGVLERVSHRIGDLIASLESTSA